MKDVAKSIFLAFYLPVSSPLLIFFNSSLLTSTQMSQQVLASFSLTRHSDISPIILYFLAPLYLWIGRSVDANIALSLLHLRQTALRHAGRFGFETLFEWGMWRWRGMFAIETQ